MQFDVFDGSSESHCPCTDCTRTVTLCDKCIDRSELGNIIFGMAGALAEYTNGQLYAAARSANGFGGVAEQATGGLGYALVTTGTLGSQLTSQELCSFFERADGNWDNVPGFAAPVGRWQWENVNQGDASENCVPCKDKLPSWYPHTIPTSSGGVAGNSRFANRPDHEDPFYVYQIPSSQFLTPELCADATVYEDTQRVNCGTGRLGD
jgi:hypothetical protein